MACTIHWSTPLSGFIGFQKDSLLPCWEILSWSLFQVTHPNPLLSAQFSLSPCLSVSRSYTRTHTHTHTHTLFTGSPGNPWPQRAHPSPSTPLSSGPTQSPSDQWDFKRAVEESAIALRPLAVRIHTWVRMPLLSSNCRWCCWWGKRQRSSWRGSPMTPPSRLPCVGCCESKWRSSCPWLGN